MKRYRFFFHYNKRERKMSVHYRGKCYLTDKVICDVPCHTKHNKRQPFCVMQGMADTLTVHPSGAIRIRNLSWISIRHHQPKEK